MGMCVRMHVRMCVRVRGCLGLGLGCMYMKAASGQEGERSPGLEQQKREEVGEKTRGGEEGVEPEGSQR